MSIRRIAINTGGGDAPGPALAATGRLMDSVKEVHRARP
jgi:6-phosphofructokinase